MKMIKDNNDKIKEEDKKELNDKMEAVRNIVKTENIEDIKKATEELSKVAQRIGGELYKTQQPSQQEPRPEASGEQPAQEAPKEEAKA